MRYLFLVALSMGLSLTAYAGPTQLTCKSVDGTLILTRDKIVALERDRVSRKMDLLILENASPDVHLDKDEVVRIAENGRDVGSLKINVISSRKVIVAGDGLTCIRGAVDGSAFSTEAYRIRGDLTLFGKKSELFDISCVETTTWSSPCEPGKEEK